MGTIINAVKWSDNTSDLAKNLKLGLDQIDATTAGVKKLVQSFEGDKVMANAQRWVAAVQALGGVTKLTAAEQERFNGVLDKAINKFTALGKPIPPLIQNFSDLTKLNIAAAKSTTDAAGATDGLSASHGKLGEFLRLNIPLFAGMSARVTENVAAFGMIGIAVGGAALAFEGAKKGLEIATQVGEDAKALRNLSTETGVNVENLQALGAVTDDYGVSTEELGRSIYNLSRRIAGGDGAAAGALGVLGLSIKELQGLAPDQIFTRVVTAVNALPDPLQRASLMATLFGGRFGQALLAIGPNLDQLVEKAKSSGEVMSGEAVEGAAKFADAIDHLGRQASVFKDSILAPLLAGLADFIDKSMQIEHVPGFKVPEPSGPLVPNMPFNPAPGKVDFGVPSITSWTTAKDIADLKVLQNVLGGLKETYTPLTALQQQFLTSVVALGGAALLSSEKVKSGATALGISAEQLGAYTTKAKAAEEAQKKMAAATAAVMAAQDGYGAVLASVDQMTLLAVLHDKDLGVTEEQLATFYHLSAEQIKAVIEGRRVDNELTKLNTTQTIANAEALGKLGGVVDEQTIPALKQYLDVRQQIFKIENESKVGAIDVSGLQVDVETVGRLKEGFDRAEKARQAFHQGLNDLSQAFAQLAQISGGSFGGIVKGIGQLVGGLNVAVQGTEAYRKAVEAAGAHSVQAWGAAASELGSYISLALEAYQILSKLTTGFSINTTAATVSTFLQSLGSDAIGKITEMYLASGRTAQDARRDFALLVATIGQGGDAAAAAIKKIKDAMGEGQEVMDAIHAAGVHSNTELQHSADVAKKAFDQALASGDYSQASLETLYYNWQKAMADAGIVAAQAWVKAHDAATGASSASTDAMKKAESNLKSLISQRDDLTKSISAEAPEAVEGVIQQQQEKQRDSLDQQIQQQADAYAKLAKDTGQQMADDIVAALERIHIDPIHIGVVVDGPNGSSGASTSGPIDIPNPGPQRDYFPDGFLGGMHGGMVRDWGIDPVYAVQGGLMPTRGTDTVAAMLTPGEGVVTTRGMDLLGEDGLAALNAGRAAGDVTIHLTVQSVLDGRIVAENTITRMARDKHGAGTKTKRALGIGV